MSVARLEGSYPPSDLDVLKQDRRANAGREGTAPVPSLRPRSRVTVRDDNSRSVLSWARLLHAIVDLGLPFVQAYRRGCGGGARCAGTSDAPGDPRGAGRRSVAGRGARGAAHRRLAPLGCRRPRRQTLIALSAGASLHGHEAPPAATLNPGNTAVVVGERSSRRWRAGVAVSVSGAGVLVLPVCRLLRGFLGAGWAGTGWSAAHGQRVDAGQGGGERVSPGPSGGQA